MDRAYTCNGKQPLFGAEPTKFPEAGEHCRSPARMCEEIEWLDEELTNLTAELSEHLKELSSKTGKKLSKGNRDDKVEPPATSMPQLR